MAPGVVLAKRPWLSDPTLWRVETGSLARPINRKGKYLAAAVTVFEGTFTGHEFDLGDVVAVEALSEGSYSVTRKERSRIGCRIESR